MGVRFAHFENISVSSRDMFSTWGHTSWGFSNIRTVRTLDTSLRSSHCRGGGLSRCVVSGRWSVLILSWLSRVRGITMFGMFVWMERGL